jgi:hypothetical protein
MSRHPEGFAILHGKCLLEFGQELRCFIKISLDQFADIIGAHGDFESLKGRQIDYGLCAHGLPL